MEQVPPHDLDAEKALLGSMLIDRTMAGMCAEIVRPEDFYHPAHGAVARAIQEMLSRDLPIDYITLRDHLSTSGGVDGVGGDEYLATLAESAPSSANGEHYARIVRDKALLRNFVTTCGNLIRDAFAEDRPVDEFVNYAETKIMETMVQRRKDEPLQIRDVLKKLFESIEKGEGVCSGLSTGFFELDEMVKLGKGHLIILAARPSIGKSSAVLGTVLHNAIRDKKRVALFSLEMKSIELAARMLSQESGVPYRTITKGKMLTSDERDRLCEANALLADADILVDHELEHGVQSIRSRCRRMVAQGGLDLVVVDYLQLIESHRRSESRRVEVDDISRGLKKMANELDVPVLALSQMSRDIEKSEREPRLSDLRESGGLEQDADTVIFLHRPHKEEAEQGGLDVEDAYLLVRKNRNGQCGKIKLQWHGPCMRLQVPYGGGMML